MNSLILCSFAEKIASNPSEVGGLVGEVVGKIRERSERRKDLKKRYDGHTPKRQDNSYFGAVKTLIKFSK